MGASKGVMGIAITCQNICRKQRDRSMFNDGKGTYG